MHFYLLLRFLRLLLVRDGFFWSAIGETLPASVSDSDEGYFSKTWDGFKTIMRDGNTGLLVPAYTIHPAWDYPNRRQENGYTWAEASPATTLMHAATAEFFMRWLFPIHTILLSLSWATPRLARWKLGASPLHLETGYTLGLTARADYRWVPIPAPLPLLGVGTDNLTFYGTYVSGPTFSFSFGNLVFPTRASAIPSFLKNLDSITESCLRRGGWQKNRYERTRRSEKRILESRLTAGARVFLTKTGRLTPMSSQSKHNLKYFGQKIGSYKLTGYSLALQYHFLASKDVSLYAGIGAGFFRLNNLQQNPGWHSRKNAFSPVIQIGATFALTKHIQLTGGLDMAFQGYKGRNPYGETYTL